jgi:hypothetical protein
VECDREQIRETREGGNGRGVGEERVPNRRKGREKKREDRREGKEKNRR